MPGELVESELFGYEEGSFTGTLKGGKKLSSEHLTEKIRDEYKKSITEQVVDNVLESNQDMLATAEKMLIERVLKSVNGNVSAAAERLGLSRRTIYKKWNKTIF